MKLAVTSVLCLSLLLAHCNISMAGIKNLFKKPIKTKPVLDSKPKQPTQFNQGGYPQQPGRPGGHTNQGGYPQYPGHTAGGYPAGSYPAYGYPYGGGYPQQPGRPGGHPNQGGYPQYPGHTAGGYPAGSYPAYGYPYGGGYGNYPGGYINYNPNNKILSPYYGSSLAYGGYGGGRGSPFSNMVKDMGYSPSHKSRGYGRSAVAAVGGAMAGMALGYGLGRLPRLHFNNPDEEYFYNYYMYRKYGIQFSDNKDRDYKYSQQVEPFSKYMASCMKRKDLLPAEREKVKHKPAVTTARTTAVTSAPNSNAGNTTETSNSTAGNQKQNNKPAAAPTNATTFMPVTSTAAAAVSVNVSKAMRKSTTPPAPLKKTEVNPVPPASQVPRNDEDDDDTVSIVEIGYPALIRQVKIKRCTELYIVYAEKQRKTASSGVQGLEMGLLGVITSAVLMLLSTNM